MKYVFSFFYSWLLLSFHLEFRFRFYFTWSVRFIGHKHYCNYADLTHYMLCFLLFKNTAKSYTAFLIYNILHKKTGVPLWLHNFLFQWRSFFNRKIAICEILLDVIFLVGVIESVRNVVDTCRNLQSLLLFAWYKENWIYGVVRSVIRDCDSWPFWNLSFSLSGVIFSGADIII